MAVPTLTFNAGTGSDTAASGAGPGTALSGTAAATVAANNVVTLAVDGPDLSGVATDSSAVMWVDSSSGRQYSAITAVDNVAKTVTCADNYANTEGTRNWGIGGKRATLDHADSRTLLADFKPGWTISLEDNQSIGSALAPTIAGDTTTGKIRFVSSVIGTQRTITQTANAAHFSMVSANNNFYHFQDLNFANSNATKTSANAFNFSASNGHGLVFVRCATDSTNVCARFLNRAATSNIKAVLIACSLKNCTSNAINITSSTQTLTLWGCWFSENGAAAVTLDQGIALVVRECIFADTTGDGLVVTGVWTVNPGGGLRTVIGNVFYSNTDGFDFSASATFASDLVHANNIYKDNTTGVRGLAVADAAVACNDYNDYHGNTTARVNLSAGTNDQTVDPAFVDAAGGNFAIGTALKALGWPGVLGIGGATTSYTDIGAAQRQEAASTSGGFIIGG